MGYLGGETVYYDSIFLKAPSKEVNGLIVSRKRFEVRGRALVVLLIVWPRLPLKGDLFRN
jgi:hypothetical protein